MTEAEGFGVAVRAYYYAVIPTLSTANTICCYPLPGRDVQVFTVKLSQIISFCDLPCKSAVAENTSFCVVYTIIVQVSIQCGGW